MGRKSKVKEEPMDAEEAGGDTTMNETTAEAELDYERLCQFVNPIAQPLASKKLAKKVYKLVKKAAKAKSLHQGVKDIRRFLRKNEKGSGIMILAGDVTPIDIYCHIPALCEEMDIPYVFTPSREHLGLALGHKRPAILVLVKKHDDYADLYQYVEEAIKILPPPY